MLVTIVVTAVVLVYMVGVRVESQSSEYHVYFTQSVTGLTPGSLVTLNGVRVGEVSSVKVNPKNVEQIKVMMSIDPETPVKVNTKAFLLGQGITGLKYIDLMESTNEAALLPSGEEIPAGKGLVDKLTDRADSLSKTTDDVASRIDHLTREENITRIDHILVQADELITNINQMSKELTKTLIVTRELLERNEAEIDRTIKNVSRASGEFDAVMREARLTLVTGRETLDAAQIDELIQGFTETNAVLRAKVEALDVASLTETFSTLQLLVVEMVKSLSTNQEQLRAMLFNMRQTTDNLKSLSRSLRDQPSQLIFDGQPEERELP